MSGRAALPPHSTSPDTSFAPPLQEAYVAPAQSGTFSRLMSSARELFPRRSRTPPPPPSNYLTLIPLSDSRLQPRDPRATIVGLLAFALAVATLVFATVPRGIYAGEVFVRPDAMSWNTSRSSYQLRLQARIPVYNPNYLRASIRGSLRVYFYKTEAGVEDFGPLSLPPRASPRLLDVEIDASDVPSEYILAILSQCSTFPEVLIFFLRGELTARFLFQEQHLTAIDTYFLIDCKNGGTVPSAADGGTLPPASDAEQALGVRALEPTAVAALDPRPEPEAAARGAGRRAGAGDPAAPPAPLASLAPDGAPSLPAVVDLIPPYLAAERWRELEEAPRIRRARARAEVALAAMRGGVTTPTDLRAEEATTPSSLAADL